MVIMTVKKHYVKHFAGLHIDEEKHPEKYMERLIALNKFYNDKIYNCDNVTKLLLKEVFIPLLQSQKLTNLFTNTF